MWDQLVIQGFFAYMLYMFGGYTLLNLLALVWLRRHSELRDYLLHETRLTGQEPGVSIIVPAYNEGAGIVSAVRSLLQQEFGDFEVIVVNDGSTDHTLEALRDAFQLYEFPQAYLRRFDAQPMRGVYRSLVEHRLRVVDKINGGSKADAVNAGLNIATRPLCCVIDADGVLDRFALLRTVQHFLDDRRVIACGGTLRPLNGCSVVEGNLVRQGLPRNLLALMQTVEYLRGFLCGRIGWAQMNALLIISGGYGMFRTDLAAAAGGYHEEMIGEDMDLVMRLHRHMLARGEPYRIGFLPETTCWTEVPETPGVLRAQRSRWQRGLLQCLWTHRALFFSRKAPGIGWLAMPFFLIVEALSPVVELAGAGILIWLTIAGRIEPAGLLLITAFAIAMGMMLSVTSLLLDSLTPGNRIELRRLVNQLLAIIFEPLLYHPLHTLFRLQGTWQWLRRRRLQWGSMTRVGDWQKSEPP